MKLTEEETVKINDLRKRIIAGEEVSDTELREAISSLRIARSEAATVSTAKKTKTAEKKAEAAKKLADVKDLFGL